MGKDTAADYLISLFGGQKKKFSTPLYEILHHAQDTLNFPREKDGQFLQYIGTEWARAKDPDVWVNYLLKDIENTTDHIFVTDLRFKNEFRLLKENGFKLVRIIRDEATIDVGRNSQHQSEIDLLDIPEDEWDCIIRNNRSLEDFHTWLRLLMATI